MDNELKDTLQLIISKIGDMDNKLTKIDFRLSNVEKNQDEMKRNQDEMKRNQDEMKRNQDEMKRNQDEMRLSQDDMKLDIRSINIRIENEIIPAIKTIAEGHQMLYDKISRIDDLSDEIDELKGAIVAVEILATGRLGN